MGRLSDRISAKFKRARSGFRTAAKKHDRDWGVITTPQLPHMTPVETPDALPTSMIPGVRRLPKRWRMFGAGFIACMLLFMAGFRNWPALESALTRLISLDVSFETLPAEESPAPPPSSQ